MSAYSGGSGHDIFGNSMDDRPVDRQFAGLFPPGTVQAADRQVTNPTNTQLSETHVLTHSHEHSDYSGDVHTHSHEHVTEADHSHHETGDSVPG